ncbi:hypothetical protein ACFQ60_41210 [Streptomyces zhihengii]
MKTTTKAPTATQPLDGGPRYEGNSWAAPPRRHGSGPHWRRRGPSGARRS